MGLRSIRTKMALFSGGATLSGALVIAAVFVLRSNALIERNITGLGTTLVKNLSHSARLGIASQDEASSAPIVDGVFEEGDVAFVAVYGREGNIISLRRRLELDLALDPTLLSDLAGGRLIDRTIDRDSGLPEGSGIYDFLSPIYLGDYPDSGSARELSPTRFAGVARLGLARSSLAEQRNDTLFWAGIIGLVAISLGVVFSYFYTRRFIRPIRQLTRGTETIGGGDLEFRIHLDTGDELQELASSFNAMAAGLAESQRALEHNNAELERKVAARTRELVQAAKLAGIGSIAGGVAHEINNPLVGILSNIQVMLQDERANEEERLLLLIERAARRCRDTVQVLLKYARPATGRSLEPVDLNTVIGDACELLAGQLEQQNVELALDLAAEERVTGNPNELQQVFTNLIVNGRDAIEERRDGPRGGTIAIRTRDRRDPEPAVVVEVEDDGCGIADENIERVFEPFYTSKAPGRGTGLGLSVVSRIVGHHRGRIEVSSRAGHRTVFEIILPVEARADG